MKDKMIFNFENMSVNDKTSKQVKKYFSRAGANIVSLDTDTKVKRSSGIKYREMLLTFADSQKIKLKIKSTGDIFQVFVNGRLTPIKNQDDQVKAVAELVSKLDAGRVAFQKKLEKTKVKLPPKIKTAAPKMLQVLTEKRDALKEAIVAVKKEIASVRGVAV